MHSIRSKVAKKGKINSSSIFNYLEVSHHCHQIGHLLCFFGLGRLCGSGNELGNGIYMNIVLGNWINIKVACNCVGFHFIEFIQQIVFAFFSNASEKFLSLLNFLHLFSHFVLQVRDAVHVHLFIHTSDRSVCHLQCVDHVDICAG